MATVEQKVRYTFTDWHIGTSNNGNRTLTERLISRPVGVDLRDRYTLAGQVTSWMNATK